MSTSLFCPHCGAAYAPGEKQCSFCQHIFADGLDPLDQNTLFHERYQILNQIGTGGFGAVYQARDTQEQQRLVAIKQINLRGLKAQEVIEATDGFNRERQFLSALTHDHLPKIYDHFTDAEHWYLIMEFIEGETLEVYLESMTSASERFVRTLSVDEIVDIGLQLCDVLNYLHSQPQPIIFRDLKPSNVMRTDGGAIYLIDFGIARYFKPGKLKDTIPFGSPGYAAPEQYGKGQTTAQADIYSLGAMLYYMLSGLDPAEKPFHFAPLRLYGVAGLAELEALIMQMVALDVQQRPRNIDVVIIELEYIRRLRGSPEHPLTFLHPDSAAQATGSMSYGQGSSAQSGQQQSQIQQTQAQSPGVGAPGMARRTLIKRGWQIGFAVGLGSIILHNVIPSFQTSPRTNTGSTNNTIAPSNTGVAPNPESYGLTMQSRFEISGEGEPNITKVLHSPRGPLFAAGDQTGKVLVWNMETSEWIYQLQVKQAVTSLSWSSDAKYLSIAAGRSVSTWKMPTVEDDTDVVIFPKDPWAVHDDILPAAIQNVSWSDSDAMTLAVGDIDGNVQVFQVSSKGALSDPLYKLVASPRKSQSPQEPQTVAMCWSKGQLFAPFDGDSVKIWDSNHPQAEAMTDTIIGLGESKRVQEILVLPMTAWMNRAVLTVDGQITLFEDSYQSGLTLVNIGKTITALACSNDGQYIFGAAGNGIYAWSTQSLTDNPLFFAQEYPILSIDYVENQDGKFVITGGVNNSITVWEIA